MAQDVRARVEKENDIDAIPEASGPPAFAAIAKDYQMTDFFLSQCGIEALIKLSSLSTKKNIDAQQVLVAQQVQNNRSCG